MSEAQESAWNLPYTIGFCIAGPRVLMLHSKFPPNRALWNGLGGGIEPGETPEESIAREIMEEAALDISQARRIKFAGIVTWTAPRDPTNAHKGMYAYVIDFGPVGVEWNSRECDEGRLEWKALDWVNDTGNREVVENIPYFLPRMLEASEPGRYHCDYADGILRGVTLHSLP